MHGAPNTARLRAGDTVKNYKELCGLLGETVLGGNSKQSQVKNWQRYFSFEKEGLKYKITEIFNNPIPKEMNANALYGKHIETILIDILSKNPDYSCCVSEQSLLTELSMCNRSFEKTKDSRRADKEFLSKHDISNIIYTDFNINARGKIHSILQGTLKSMKRRGLIDYHEITLIRKDNGNGWIEFIEPDEEQYKMLQEVREYVMDNMNVSNMLHAIRTNKDVLYYKSVNKEISKRYKDLYGWTGVLSRLKIKGNKDLLQAVRSGDGGSVKNSKKELNNLVVSAIKEVMERRVGEWQKDYAQYVEDFSSSVLGKAEGHIIEEKMPMSLKKNRFIGQDGYAEKYNYLIDHFIKVDGDEQNVEVQSYKS